MAHTTSWTHEGYSDALNGREPNPELDKSCDYIDGYLAGMVDREAGVQVPKYFGYCSDEELPSFSKGQQVTIPKGTTIDCTGPQRTKVAARTYKITVHDVYPGIVAYRDYNRDSRGTDGIVRPRNPRVVWIGAGGYWHEADVNAIPEFNS